MKAAMELDESLQGEIFVLHDDYNLGPIFNIYEEEGRKTRIEWWSTVLSGGDFEKILAEKSEADYNNIVQLTERLQNDENETVWIWAAQNSHDVSGYYWLLHFLKPFQGRVQILYLNNLPFINEKGNIFYPTRLEEIPAKEFIKAKKLARDITLSEFEVDPDEWIKLCNESKSIRILEGGKKLVQQDEESIDAEIKKYIMPDWQKGNKIIHNFLSKSKHHLPEAFLLYRLKALVSSDNYDVQGKVINMKDFEIKYKAKAEQEI